jgi:MscS family membrane protein
MSTAGQRNPGNAGSLLVLARLEELAVLSVLRRCIHEQDSGRTLSEATAGCANERVSGKRVAMGVPNKWVKHLERAAVLTLFLAFCPAVWPQASTRKPATTEAQPEPPKEDVLGRTTPRGAVMGFLNASRKGNAEIAALYLNTPLRGRDAENLASQLAVVLNRRLPARLNELSDKPEGSLPDPLRPDEDLVGTISAANGNLDITLERVDREKLGRVRLFSRTTLNSIPNVFQELATPAVERLLPDFLVKTRVAEIPLFEWLAVFVGLPVLYLLTGLLDRIISLGVGVLRRRLRRNVDLQTPQVLPQPIRLLLLAITIRWLLSRVGLPLLARQFWSTTAQIVAIGGCVWLLMLLNRWGEHYLVGRRPGLSGSASVLRLLRRLIDGFALFAGLLFTLYHFGVDPTAALAGLGVGGIAIALAAQKTLENVIAGISLIADQAVRVGDTLKLGDIVGTIEDVGLRSTRIRTPDRTIVSLPNGQIANMNLEALSARDKFWFHPRLGLRFETTPVQLRSAMIGIRNMLREHSNVDSLSVRVRFLQFGASSLDLDISAYMSALDWNEFLQIQGELLLNVMDIVQTAGAEIALPSQTMYLTAHSSDTLARLNPPYGRKRGTDAHHNESDIH